MVLDIRYPTMPVAELQRHQVRPGLGLGPAHWGSGRRVRGEAHAWWVALRCGACGLWTRAPLARTATSEGLKVRCPVGCVAQRVPGSLSSFHFVPRAARASPAAGLPPISLAGSTHATHQAHGPHLKRHIHPPRCSLQAAVNALCWAPHSAAHLCSAGDDCQALIWDLGVLGGAGEGGPAAGKCKSLPARPRRRPKPRGLGLSCVRFRARRQAFCRACLPPQTSAAGTAMLPPPPRPGARVGTASLERT